MIWSFILLLTNIFNFLLTPIEFSFNDYFENNLNIIINKIIFFFFVIDIGFQLNLAIYENFEIIRERKKILILYFKRNFFSHIIPTITIYIYI